MLDIPTLDGEDWWASEAIDDTDSLIMNLLDLSKSCIELSIRIEDAKQLFSDLSLHNRTHNIELETDKWLAFCEKLIGTAVAETAAELEDRLKAYVTKHLKQSFT